MKRFQLLALVICTFLTVSCASLAPLSAPRGEFGYFYRGKQVVVTLYDENGIPNSTQTVDGDTVAIKYTGGKIRIGDKTYECSYTVEPIAP